jgi:hypothetical protein
VLDYDGGNLQSVELHPFTRDTFIEGSLRRTAALSGLPLKPDVGHANKLLERFAALSEPYGTVVRIRDGIGHIPIC